VSSRLLAVVREAHHEPQAVGGVEDGESWTLFHLKLDVVPERRVAYANGDLREASIVQDSVKDVPLRLEGSVEVIRVN